MREFLAGGMTAMTTHEAIVQLKSQVLLAVALQSLRVAAVGVNPTFTADTAQGRFSFARFAVAALRVSTKTRQCRPERADACGSHTTVREFEMFDADPRSLYGSSEGCHARVTDRNVDIKAPHTCITALECRGDSR